MDEAADVYVVDLICGLVLFLGLCSYTHVAIILAFWTASQFDV